MDTKGGLLLPIIEKYRLSRLKIWVIDLEIQVLDFGTIGYRLRRYQLSEIPAKNKCKDFDKFESKIEDSCKFV